MQKFSSKEIKTHFDYYLYLDYSGDLVGYIIIKKEKISNLLPKITKLHYYKDIKNKKSYISSIKKVLDKNKIIGGFLKTKICKVKDNLYLFVEIVDFVKIKFNEKIFISIDDNQFRAFERLISTMQYRNIKIVKESTLKKGSTEYKLSLIIDTLLNIERLSK